MNSKMPSLLIKAGKIALSSNSNDAKRNFILGCIGVRDDGTHVSAKNGAVITSSYKDYRIISDAHAEVRCIRKMGKGGTIFTARILKKDGSFAMARACEYCQNRIKMAGISRVFYTIDNFHYGIWYPNINFDKVYEI